MSNRVAVIAAIFVAGLCGDLMGQSDQATVVGLTVAMPDKTNQFGQSIVPGMPSGVQVYVRVLQPDHYIIKIADEDKPNVSLKDSSGKKLKMDTSNFGFMSNIAEDHHSVTIPFSSSDLPAKDATSISVVAEVELVCGSEPAEETVPAKLEESASVKWGGIDAKITQVGDGFDEGSVRVELEAHQSFETIQSVTFVTNDGKEIEASRAGSSSFGFGNQVTCTQGFQFKGAADNVKSAKVKYFKKSETIKVPLNLQATLGLGG